MKKNILLMLVFMIMIIPFKVNALNGNVGISCTSVNDNGEASCKITGSSDEAITSLMAQVSVSDNLEIGTFTADSIWQESDFAKNQIATYKSCDDIAEGDCVISGNFVIGTVNVKIKENFTGTGTITVSSIKFLNDSPNQYAVADTSASVKMYGLKSLSFNDESGEVLLQPAFTNENDGYSITISSKTFSVNAVPRNSSDTVTIYNGDTEETLSSTGITYNADGKEHMLIEIKVGTGDDAKVYQVIVNSDYEEEQITCDSSLKSLVVGGKVVNLVSGKYDYEVTLSSISNYSYKAVLKDTDNYQFDDVSVGEKNNNSSKSFSIKVLPKGDKCTEGSTYNITVKEDSSSNVTPPVDNDKPSSGNTVNKNPQTSDISMFLMALVLIGSFIVSMTLYKRNIQGYNK